MPAPSSIGRQPKIFLQPLMALWPWTLRQIIGNRLRRLADRPESFPGVCAHEAENLRKQRGDTTKRGAYRDRLCARAAGELGGDNFCVRGIVRELVSAGRDPVG